MPAQAGRSTTEQRRHLLAVLTPVVAASGFDLEDLTVRTVGRRSLLRLVVDGDDGVDLDDVATVSRVVSSKLDADGGDLFAGPYVLEVTSPGVDRPLTERRHWTRAVGRLVAVNGTTGRVATVGDNGVELVVDGRRSTTPWAHLGPGAVQVEFHRSADLDDEPGEA